MSIASARQEAYALQAVRPDDTTVIEALWRASQDADDRAFRPRQGWWSLSAWGHDLQVLTRDAIPVGAAAFATTPDHTVEVRLALTPSERTAEAGELLLLAAIDWAQRNHLLQVRLTTPAAARWAIAPAAAMGFRFERAIQIMLRSPIVPIDAPSVPPDLRIRSMRAGEESRVLEALNRAWAGTWNFYPLTLAALNADVHGQPENFLLAVDATDGETIVGTVHARFDAHAHNPDGAPFAWISNLTTHPVWRGRGLGRALLNAGIARLSRQGARSVALGVDAGNPAPLALYQSAGFATIDSLEFWQYALG